MIRLKLKIAGKITKKHWRYIFKGKVQEKLSLDKHQSSWEIISSKML